MTTILESTWPSHNQFNAAYYAGAAEYWGAMSAKESALQKGTGYGEEILRLTRAENMLTQSTSIENQQHLPMAVSAGAESLLRTANKCNVTAKKDNSQIYLEPLPPENRVPAISPISMVKPTLALDYAGSGNNQNTQHLFKEFMSKQLITLVNSFKDELNSLTRTQFSEVSKATNEARSTLSSVGLPGSLEAYKSGGTLPANLWTKIERIQTLGGVEELQRKLRNVNGNAESCRDRIQNIDSVLEREEEVDEEFRKKCVTFKSATLKELDADVKSHNTLLKDAHVAACEGDKTLITDIQDEKFVSWMDKLMQPRDKVSALLPKPSGAPGAAGAIDTKELETLLVEMATLLDARESTMKGIACYAEEITNANSGDARNGCDPKAIQLQQDFFKKMSTGQTNEQILAAAMGDSKNQAVIVKQTIDRQQVLLPQIMAANQIFMAARQETESSITIERDAVIRNMEQTIAQYFAVNSRLTAGMTFYHNLQVCIRILF